MIIFFGPPGSGKSTQGRTIADKYGWRWLSAGQVLRDTGRFDEILKSGELVDDETVVKLMAEQISRANAEGMEIILDGYPRDEKQTEIMLSGENSNFFDEISLAIVLDVPKEELWKRIAERGRADDTQEVMERRLEKFWGNIEAIFALLKERQVPIIHVDGVGEYDAVTERIETEMFKIIPKTPEVFAVTEPNVVENDSVEREKSYGE